MVRGQRTNRTFDDHVWLEGKIRHFKEIKKTWLVFLKTFLSSKASWSKKLKIWQNLWKAGKTWVQSINWKPWMSSSGIRTNQRYITSYQKMHTHLESFYVRICFRWSTSLLYVPSRGKGHTLMWKMTTSGGSVSYVNNSWHSSKNNVKRLDYRMKPREKKYIIDTDTQMIQSLEWAQKNYDYNA